MATKKLNTASALGADGSSRRRFLKAGAAALGAGLITTVAARNARADGSWGGGEGGGGDDGDDKDHKHHRRHRRGTSSGAGF